MRLYFRLISAVQLQEEEIERRKHAELFAAPENDEHNRRMEDHQALLRIGRSQDADSADADDGSSPPPLSSDPTRQLTYLETRNSML